MISKWLTEKRVTIVVPVYGDWSSLEECIKSLKKNVDARHKIVFVNDCGPEADDLEKKVKAATKRIGNTEYYRNPENLGFVKTCNRAVLELDKTDNDILLLNSDTKVTKNFLEEMIAVLYSSPKIAAVSPRSNNATIFSIPFASAGETNYSMKDSYRIFKKVSPKLPQKYMSPIAHGFCILIRRQVIKEHGLFDEVYGKGYGEENDFCMRVYRESYRCAVANRAFVFHYRARSFTPAKRSTLVAKNDKIFSERYPEYEGLMKEFAEKTLIPSESEIMATEAKKADKSFTKRIRGRLKSSKI